MDHTMFFFTPKLPLVIYGPDRIYTLILCHTIGNVCELWDIIHPSLAILSLLIVKHPCNTLSLCCIQETLIGLFVWYDLHSVTLIYFPMYPSTACMYIL